MIGHVRIPFLSCLVLASALALTTVGHAQDDLSDLDEQLQSEFGDDLLEGLDDIPLDPDFGNTDEEKSPADNDLRRDLTEGEDIGQPAEDDPTRIARLMRQAQQRIENQEVSADTQNLQQEIVAELEALIKELQRQKKQSNSSTSPSSSAGNPQVEQPDQQPDAGQQSPSNNSGDNSTERLGAGGRRCQRCGRPGGAGETGLGAFARPGAATNAKRDRRGFPAEVSTAHRGLLSPVGRGAAALASIRRASGNKFAPPPRIR